MLCYDDLRSADATATLLKRAFCAVWLPECRTFLSDFSPCTIPSGLFRLTPPIFAIPDISSLIISTRWGITLADDTKQRYVQRCVVDRLCNDMDCANYGRSLYDMVCRQEAAGAGRGDAGVTASV